jgi:terminase small subunit-like protein
MGALKDPQYEKFASELAELKAPIEAYKLAGYAPHRGNANRLAKRAEIKFRVAELLEEAAEYADIRRVRVLVEIDRVARANLADFFERVAIGKDDQGRERHEIRMRDITTLPRHLTAAIAGIEWDDAGRPKLKLHDKNQANFTLLKHLGGLPEDTKPDVNIFNLLSVEDQRVVVAALEAFSGGQIAAGGATEVEPQPA